MSTPSFDREATLCYIKDEDAVLLIKKKRGVGEGLYNGPGGKIEGHDNTPREAAIRETVEETGVQPIDPAKIGELEFFFGNDPFQRVHIFHTASYDGEPEETEEAEPVWTPIDGMPYQDMWEDDRYWMPLMFNDVAFTGFFRFDEGGEKLVEWTLEDASF